MQAVDGEHGNRERIVSVGECTYPYCRGKIWINTIAVCHEHLKPTIAFCKENRIDPFKVSRVENIMVDGVHFFRWRGQWRLSGKMNRYEKNKGKSKA